MVLIVQSPELTGEDVTALAAATGQVNAEVTTYAQLDESGARAVRLRADPSTPGIAEYCSAHRLDFAWVPEQRRLADVGLVAMDMDSTLITIECIDEIADLQGIKPQVAAITAS